MVLYELRHPSQRYQKRRRLKKPGSKPFTKVLLEPAVWVTSLFGRFVRWVVKSLAWIGFVGTVGLACAQT